MMQYFLKEILPLLLILFSLLALVLATDRWQSASVDNFPANYYSLQLMNSMFSHVDRNTTHKLDLLTLANNLKNKRDACYETVLTTYMDIARKLDPKRLDPAWLIIIAKTKKFKKWDAKVQKIWKEVESMQ